MLEPHDRRLLLESLRPPDGYELDFAIATTFTLDLLSLLTAPLGFTFFELDGDASGAATAIDPLVLLRTIRRYADRMAIFCQAGRIAVPRKQQLLFANLEQSVIEVKAPIAGGVFHPKVWVLRFKGADASIRYRLLCLSRNLTFDCSWDTSLILDGAVADRQVGYGANRALGDFISALPAMAIARDLPQRVIDNVKTASTELRKVDFELPAPFEEYGFVPLGIKGYTKSPFTEPAARRLVISPFLTPAIVGSLSSGNGKHVLVSRLDTLQTFSEKNLEGFDAVYALNPDASTEMQLEAVGDNENAVPSAGLHAKLFVEDRGWNAAVFTGSANATDAAFGRNVEFLVELVGKKSACGVEAILGAQGEEGTLRSLLMPFEALETPVQCDEVLERLDQLIDDVRRAFSEVPWGARVESTPEGFHIALVPLGAAMPVLPANAMLRCWPITLADTSAMRYDVSNAFQFGPLSFEALTAFFAFEVTVLDEDKEASARFTVTARLTGAPPDRREKLLRYHLQNPQQIIRFLLLLLSSDDPAETDVLTASANSVASSNGYGINNEVEALLEPLLRALDGNLASLDQVAETLCELRGQTDGESNLPVGLDRIWKAVWAARETLRPKVES